MAISNIDKLGSLYSKNYVSIEIIKNFKIISALFYLLFKLTKNYFKLVLSICLSLNLSKASYFSHEEMFTKFNIYQIQNRSREVVPVERKSRYMHQIYGRAPMSMCYSKKIALQPDLTHTLFSLLNIPRNVRTPFYKVTYGNSFLIQITQEDKIALENHYILSFNISAASFNICQPFP